MRDSTCRSCGARITWAITPAGKKCPLDFAKTPDGEYVTIAGSECVVKYDPDVHAGRTRFTSHFKTCPQAQSHTKRPVRR